MEDLNAPASTMTAQSFNVASTSPAGRLLLLVVQE
jgi:hypothetical protein